MIIKNIKFRNIESNLNLKKMMKLNPVIPAQSYEVRLRPDFKTAPADG